MLKLPAHTLLYTEGTSSARLDYFFHAQNVLLQVSIGRAYAILNYACQKKQSAGMQKNSQIVLFCGIPKCFF